MYRFGRLDWGVEWQTINGVRGGLGAGGGGGRRRIVCVCGFFD